MGAIIGANAIGVVILLAIQALPGAIFAPGAEVSTEQRVQVMAITTFLVVPVAILLLTVGRLASGTRDRRLASLRILGLNPRRTRLVAMGENGVLALVGAALGALAFTLLAPVLDDVVARGPAWFSASLQVTPGVLILTTLGVVALSAVTSIAGTRAMNREPRAARSQSARRTPRPWALLPLVIGVASLSWVVRNPAGSAGLFLLGALGCAIAVALLPSLLTSWVSGLLVRLPFVSTTLAARSIQVEPASAGRLVAGLGVTTFLVVATFGWLGAYLSTPQFRLADQMMTDGPQTVWLQGGGFEPGTTLSSLDFTERDWTEEATALTAADREALRAVPGVLGITRNWDYWMLSCQDGEPCPQPFVGTCEELALLMTVSGCSDDRAGVILPVNVGVEAEDFLSPQLPDPTLRPTLVVAPGNDEPFTVDAAAAIPAESRIEIPLAGEPLLQDVNATAARWVYPSHYEAFIPHHLISDQISERTRGEIIADGGPAVLAAIEKVAAERGILLTPYPKDDYDQGMRVRAAVLALSAVIIGIGLIGLCLGAIDRAKERQRPVARLVAVGIPAWVLRAGQLWQTLLPLVFSVGAAAACGVLLVRALAAIDNFADLLAASSMPILLVAVGLGVALVSLVTLPLTRARLTPELLRNE